MPEEKRPLKVFLCHASADRQKVRELYRYLRRRGIQPWLDTEDLVGGQDWQVEIPKALATSDAILICLTKNSVSKDGYIQKEIRFALDKALEMPEGRIFLIPVRLEECEVPLALSRYQWVDLFVEAGYPRMMKALKARASQLSRGLAVITPSAGEEVTHSIPEKKERQETPQLQNEVKRYSWRNWFEPVIVLFKNLDSAINGQREEINPTVKDKPKERETSYEKQLQQAQQVINRFALSLGLDIVADKNSGSNIVYKWNTRELFRDLPFPRSLPALAIVEKDLTENGVEKIRHILINRLDSKSRITLFFLFCNVEALNDAKRKLSLLRNAYAYDVIILHQKDLVDIVSSDDPKRVFRRFIISQINLTAISPYIITGPTPKDFFFGREHELREITEHVRNVSFAIIGGRRIGKTSILNRLYEIRLPYAGFRTVYFDCSIVSHIEEFLSARVNNWQSDVPKGSPFTFADLLKAPPLDKPLVLLLDEADKLVPKDRNSNWMLFNMLRSAANSKAFQVILSGERTLREGLRDPQSPLFNFTNEIVLGPLDYQSVSILVKQPMKQLEIELIGEQKIVDQVWFFTSGHPNVVQRLCRRLVDRVNLNRSSRITLADVDAVIDDIEFQRQDYLDTYWESASTLEKIITLILANGNEVRTLPLIRKELTGICGFDPGIRAIDDALERLTSLRSIIRRTLPSGYEFAVESFPRVIAKTMTVSDMLDILIEKYKEEINDI